MIAVYFVNDDDVFFGDDDASKVGKSQSHARWNTL